MNEAPRISPRVSAISSSYIAYITLVGFVVIGIVMGVMYHSARADIDMPGCIVVIHVYIGLLVGIIKAARHSKNDEPSDPKRRCGHGVTHDYQGEVICVP